MPKIKVLTLENNEKMHEAVFPIIKEDDKYLIIKRKNTPIAYAGIAGHVDEGETPDEAVIREVKEETGLEIISKIQLFEDIVAFPPPCRYDSVLKHKIYVYEVEVAGKLEISEDESDNFGWYTLEEVGQLDLEKAWEYIFIRINSSQIRNYS